MSLYYYYRPHVGRPSVGIHRPRVRQQQRPQVIEPFRPDDDDVLILLSL